MKIAAATYPPEWHADWTALAAKLEAWVSDAVGQGADLLVFPEYAGIEVALIGQPPTGAEPTPAEWGDRMAAAEARWKDLHTDLATRHGVHILAGSLAAKAEAGMVNRAWLCSPGGAQVAQDKLIPTPYERREMGLIAGSEMQVISTALGKIGILICYDAEFPLLARAMLEAGAELLLVPSCTELPAGLTRVRQSARARAIEGQCLVVHAPLTGTVPGCDIVSSNSGRAGIFCPPDYGLPPDGIVAQGELNVPGWTFAEVDLTRIGAARTGGQVGNYAHWSEQTDHLRSVISCDIC